jgi:hypothetical protein
LDQYGTDRKPASEFKNHPSQELNATIKRTLETHRQPLFRAPFLAPSSCLRLLADLALLATRAIGRLEYELS